MIPVFNKLRYLPACIDAVLAAARRYGPVDIALVDHRSTDGSYEFLERYRNEAQVVRLDGGTISSVRNYGASCTDGELLSFLDCDCVVPPDYFTALVDVFATTGAGAAGCEVNIPTPAHWIEAVWHRLHVIGDDGYRHYLNSANFAVRRRLFDEIGGFDVALVTGEDTDICTRIRLAGHAIFESHRLSVVHLDNPKSLSAFYRKEVWRGLGAFSGTLRTQANKATLMVFANILLTVLALALLVVPGGVAVGTRVLIAGAAILAVPAATVAYRFGETRRVTNPPAALLLYTVYYLARSHALVRTLFRDATPRPAAAMTGTAPGERSAS